MIKVNLSRIHSMIKNYTNDCNALGAAIINNNLRSYSFKIFEKTNDSDLLKVQNHISTKVADFNDSVKKCTMYLKYTMYLKNILESKNAQYSISKKLNEISFLNRERILYKNIYNMLQDRVDSQDEEIKNVEFYKSVYTDDCKIYTLNLNYFSKKDLESFKNKLDMLDKKLKELNDDVALLNQTKFVNILEFDEFVEEFILDK